MLLELTFSILLPILATSANYSFPDAIINLSTISSGSIQYLSGTQDACDKLIVRNLSVHHMNTNHSY